MGGGGGGGQQFWGQYFFFFLELICRQFLEANYWDQIRGEKFASILLDENLGSKIWGGGGKKWEANAFESKFSWEEIFWGASFGGEILLVANF